MSTQCGEKREVHQDEEEEDEETVNNTINGRYPPAYCNYVASYPINSLLI
jgi:hypothetical protein